MRISRQELNVAGWLSIANAIITVPSAILAIVLTIAEGRTHNTALVVILILMVLVNTGLSVYLLTALKRMLNGIFLFFKADVWVIVLICLNVGYALLSIALMGTERPDEVTVGDILGVLAGFAIGAIYIVVGVMLLRLPNGLFGLLKPFCGTLIGLGVCCVSIVLLLLAPFVSMAADILLGMIFLKVADMGVGHDAHRGAPGAFVRPPLPPRMGQQDADGASKASVGPWTPAEDPPPPAMPSFPPWPSRKEAPAGAQPSVPPSMPLQGPGPAPNPVLQPEAQAQAWRMTCPSCRRLLRVTLAAAGRTVPCPACHEPVIVPPDLESLEPIP